MTKTLSHCTILCVVMLTAASGCSTLQKQGESGAWSIKKLWKQEYQKPASMAIIWSPDVLTVAGKPPTRGFGGRIFFYNDKNQAIPVEGDVIVHGFLGDPAFSGNKEADKTFAFTAEQLTSHYSPSQLGASYSIWIPWDAAGGHRDQVTLIPTFKVVGGGIVQGAAAKLILPGKEKEGLASRRRLPAQTVSFRRSSTPTNPGVDLPGAKKRGAMKTTTIDVPSGASLAKRKSVGSETYGSGGHSKELPTANSATLGAVARPSDVLGGNDDELKAGKTLSNGVQVGGLPQSTSPVLIDKQAQSLRPPVIPTAQADKIIEKLNEFKLEEMPPTELESLPIPTASRRSFKSPKLPNIATQVRQASYQSQPANRK